MFKFFFLLGFNLQKLLAICHVRVQFRYSKVQIKGSIYYLGSSRVKNSFFLSTKPRSSFFIKEKLVLCIILVIECFPYRYRQTYSFGFGIVLTNQNFCKFCFRFEYRYLVDHYYSAYFLRIGRTKTSLLKILFYFSRRWGRFFRMKLFKITVEFI